MARWRVADAAVCRYSDFDEEWYCLSVRPRAGDAWQLVCRRRTLAGLLELIENRAAWESG
jgi:hypothetical protein